MSSPVAAARLCESQRHDSDAAGHRQPRPQQGAPALSRGNSSDRSWQANVVSVVPRLDDGPQGGGGSVLVRLRNALPLERDEHRTGSGISPGVSAFVVGVRATGLALGRIERHDDVFPGFPRYGDPAAQGRPAPTVELLLLGLPLVLEPRLLLFLELRFGSLVGLLVEPAERRHGALALLFQPLPEVLDVVELGDRRPGELADAAERPATHR